MGSSAGDQLADYTPDQARVLVDTDLERVSSVFHGGETPDSLELAGPREQIYFDPSKLKAGIVTCGGLCPGLNDVIRGLVMTLHHRYGVPTIFGFKYGFAGLNPEYGHPVLELSPESVRDIHTRGGTILGTSRGHQDVGTMVDTLERMNIGLLFTIGGDGTFRGALAIADEIAARGLKIGVVAIPKTIDNDIEWVDHTFGFQTAVSHAAAAIVAGYAEASSAENGIGLVKLMGRESGFIAASAALAVRNVNIVLVPEVPFSLEGENGLIAYLGRRMEIGKFSVIVAAEGAGQDLLQSEGKTDASGNVKLGDIGTFLRDQIVRRLHGQHRFTIKYIDPSYIIRSAPADSNDAIFCGHLAQAAAHAGMTGRTAMAVGRWQRSFTHIPLQLMVMGRKKIDPEGDLWRSLLESTGQPARFS
jgi:6-phosphofructokinase 1